MGYFPNSISNGTKGPRVSETLSVGMQQPGLRATYIYTIAQISLPLGIHCQAGLYVQVGWRGGVLQEVFVGVVQRWRGGLLYMSSLLNSMAAAISKSHMINTI